MYKHTILSHLIDYLKLRNIPFKTSGKVTMLQCPFCQKQPMSANIIPNTKLIHCFCCKRKYNLIDLATVFEYDDKMPNDEEEVLELLKDILKIEVMTKADEQNINNALDFYVENKFDLVRIVPNTKIPIKNVSWNNVINKDKKDWQKWLDEGANIGVKTGKRSDVTILDIDVLTKPEKKEFILKKTTSERKKELSDKRNNGIKTILNKVKELKSETLVNYSLGGCHLIYKYEEELPKTSTQIEGINIDIENDGGYVVIYPSKVDNIAREIKEFKPIAMMSNTLKELLKSKITVPKKTFSEKIREDIQTEEFKIDPKDFQLKNNNLEGCCNSSFIRLGGILRKQLNPQQTGYVLHVLNKHLLADPMDTQAINSMIRELDRYNDFDEDDLANEIIKYMKNTEPPSKAEIEMAILGDRAKGENRKRIDKTLKYLIAEEKIVSRGRVYELVKDMDWTDTLTDIGIPVNFKVPYFNDYAHFNVSDLVIIGSQNKYGKSTLAINIVKRFVKQGIKPYYIYNESGGRYGKTARILGMKDGDFNKVFCSDPEKIILRPNAVTIFDWVKPNDFAKTADLFNTFIEKLEKTKGFMICFVQLKDKDIFFAPNQIGQFPSVLSRYVYEDDKDGTNTKFVLDDVRDPKMKGKKFEIPAIYNWDTHEVFTVEELEKNNE